MATKSSPVVIHKDYTLLTYSITLLRIIVYESEHYLHVYIFCHFNSCVISIPTVSSLLYLLLFQESNKLSAAL